MKDISIKVEAYAGSDCAKVIGDMCQLSNQLGIDVEARLNGITTVARPLCDRKRLVKDWEEMLGSKKPNPRMVFGQPIEYGTVVEQLKATERR